MKNIFYYILIISIFNTVKLSDESGVDSSEEWNESESYIQNIRDSYEKFLE